jgi:hypothetical protein
MPPPRPAATAAPLLRGGAPKPPDARSPALGYALRGQRLRRWPRRRSGAPLCARRFQHAGAFWQRRVPLGPLPPSPVSLFREGRDMLHSCGRKCMRSSRVLGHVRVPPPFPE